MSLHEAALKKGNLWLLRRRKRKADPGPFEKNGTLENIRKGADRRVTFWIGLVFGQNPRTMKISILHDIVLLHRRNMIMNSRFVSCDAVWADLI
jgi:hypothetical protein